MLKKLLKVLLMADACFIFAAGLLGPIYAIFVSEIGGDLLDAGWAWAAFMLTSGIVVFLLSRWENKVKHYEKLIVGGYAIRSAAVLGYVFVSNPLQLMMAQAFLGLGEAFTLPAYDALFTKTVEKGKEAAQWGNWEAMDYIITAFSAILGSALATAFGFRTLFIAMFVVSFTGLLLSIRLTSHIRRHMPQPSPVPAYEEKKR